MSDLKIASTGGGGSHDILSATHPDSFAADTKVDGDVLTWVSAASRWEAVAPGAASHPAAVTHLKWLVD